MEQVGNIKVNFESIEEINKAMIEANVVRCPDFEAAQQMLKLIEEVRNDGDSVGGIIKCL